MNSPALRDKAPAGAMRRPLRPSQLTPVRRRLSPFVARRLFQAADALVLIAALAAAEPHGLPFPAGWIAGALGAAFALGVFGAYSFPKDERLRAHLAFVLVVAVASAAAFQRLAGGAALGREEALEGALAAGLAVSLVHAGWWAWVRRWRRIGVLTPNLVIVGATPLARDLILQLLHRREANVIGIFDDRGARSPDAILGVPVLGGLDDLVAHRTLPAVDRIVIAVPEHAGARVSQLLDRLSSAPNEIMLVVNGEQTRAAERLGHLSLRSLEGHRFDGWRAAVKRAQDLALAGSAVLLLAPVLLAIGVAVKLDSAGPVFFRQRRHGFNNEEFWVWKFRSMRAEAADATASRQVSADDDRVTRLGRFLRRTSLDELPQLFNVVLGEMSLVGPRPHAVGMKSAGQETARLVERYAHRHRLKPGLTGWAAIHGSRGPVDDAQSLRRRIALDLEYIERQSFWLDLWVMLKTAPLVLGDRSAQR